MVTGVMSSKYFPDRSRGLTVAFPPGKVGVIREKGRVMARPTGSFNKVLEVSRAEYLFFQPTIPDYVAASHIYDNE